MDCLHLCGKLPFAIKSGKTLVTEVYTPTRFYIHWFFVRNNIDSKVSTVQAKVNMRWVWILSLAPELVMSLQLSALSASTALKIHCGKMNSAGDGDDEKPDDDWGNSHVERVPAQPPGAFVVSAVITVSRHDREDQSHNVDGVCRTKACKNGQTKVALKRWW